MCVQKSERPGVFVGILRAGLGPFLKQAAGLLVARSDSTKACPGLCSPHTLFCHLTNIQTSDLSLCSQANRRQTGNIHHLFPLLYAPVPG